MTSEQKALIERYRRRYQQEIEQLWHDTVADLAVRLELPEEEVAKLF